MATIVPTVTVPHFLGDGRISTTERTLAQSLYGDFAFRETPLSGRAYFAYPELGESYRRPGETGKVAIEQ